MTSASRNSDIAKIWPAARNAPSVWRSRSKILIRACSVLRSKPWLGHASIAMPVKCRGDFLERHRAPADRRIVDRDAALAYSREHHEVIVVPVQQAWQAQPPKIAHLRLHRARGQLELVREPHDVVQRHALERDVVIAYAVRAGRSDGRNGRQSWRGRPAHIPLPRSAGSPACGARGRRRPPGGSACAVISCSARALRSARGSRRAVRESIRRSPRRSSSTPASTCMLTSTGCSRP